MSQVLTFRRLSDGLMHIQAVVGDVLDYSILWEEWLDGATITSSVWTVPALLTAGPAVGLDTVTTQWLTGTAVGAARVDNRIGDSLGRFIRRSFVLDVVEAMS